MAAAFDAQEKPVEAAEAYEVALGEGGARLESYFDLAVLYWVATDVGYFSHHHLTDDFVRQASTRSRELLIEVEVKFGPYNETDFWRYYFDYISLGKDVNLPYCRELAIRGPSPIPYFHLFSVTGDLEYRRQAELLLSLVKSGRTERQRYVRSMLHSALRS